MTKTYLALALLITVLAANAYGDDEVYYCAGIDSNGFEFDEKIKKYTRSGFLTEKFKIKFDRTAKTVEVKGAMVKSQNVIYSCTDPWAHNPEKLTCSNNFYHFSFNSDNGRFVFAMLYGYIAGGDDSLAIEYGTCDKF